MICIEAYMKQLICLLQEAFGRRLTYVGLQGSYLRGEATDQSDIDVMVVLDGLTVEDLGTYKTILKAAGHYDLSCGFLCGKAELAGWNPLEISHLLHTTKDYCGRLRELVPAYTRQDEKNFILYSLNNLYHELCHRYIHSDREKSILRFPASCKSVFFILQNMHYFQTGIFAASKQELLERLTGQDKEVLMLSMECQKYDLVDFDRAFDLLFGWCQNAIIQIAGTVERI